MKTLKLKLDDLDFEAIQEAIAIRKSGLFHADGVLIMPGGESEPRGGPAGRGVPRLDGACVRRHDPPGEGQAEGGVTP
jgi:hypothetical protein